MVVGLELLVISICLPHYEVQDRRVKEYVEIHDQWWRGKIYISTDLISNNCNSYNKCHQNLHFKDWILTLNISQRQGS